MVSKKNQKTSKKQENKKNILSECRTMIFVRILFFLFSFLFLGIYNAELLYKLQGYSLFFNNSVFAAETLKQSAGVLVYLSCFLTQFLYYPLLGALFLSLGLSFIEWCISSLFRIPFRYFFVSFLPSGLILLAQTSIGYALYDNFDSSFIFSSVLGPICSLLLFILYRRLKSFSFGSIIALAVAFASFFAIGSYAFVGVLMILSEKLVNKEKFTWILFLLCLVLIALLPYITSRYVYYESYIASIISPVPQPYFKNLFVIMLLSQFLLILFPYIRIKCCNVETSSKNRWINILSLSLFLVFIFCFSFRDKNFRIELKLQHLTEKHKWNEIIKTAESVSTPTKAIVAYRAIALANTNQLVQRLFQYPYQYKPTVSSYLTEEPVYYEDLFFYASYINSSYMWTMEFWVTTGRNFAHLKRMALCAFMNGETELTKRYITLLKQTMFHSEWAKEFEKYLDDPDELYKKYPVYQKIKQSVPIQENIITLKSLPNTYQEYMRLSPVNMERRILADLYLKDMKLFMRDISKLQKVYAQGAPDCIKEALVICAMNGNPAILKYFKVERPLAEKVSRFFQELNTYQNFDQASEKLKEKYGNMYCYYFIFSGEEKK